MKIKLHRPKNSVWTLALVAFIVGILASLISIPLLSGLAFYLIAFSSGLLLLGTWIV